MNDHDRQGIDRTRGTDDARSAPPGVTGEVGSEGGSFADPTSQVATFHEALDQIRGERAAESPAAQAIRSGDPSGAAAAGGFVRYPTEAPADPPVSGASGETWRIGLIGAAAGFALGILVHRLSSRGGHSSLG